MHVSIPSANYKRWSPLKGLMLRTSIPVTTRISTRLASLDFSVLLKPAVHGGILRAAERKTGFFDNRAQTIFVIARRGERAPHTPPSFMLYGGSDERSGYNF